MRRPIVVRVVATLFMLGGSSLVFSLVLYMNQQDKPTKPPLETRKVEFQVQRPPPPKRQQPRERHSQRQRQRSSAPAPKAPELSLGISAVAIQFGGAARGARLASGEQLLGPIDKQAALTESALDEVPRLRSRGGTQQYPAQARRQGLEGYVTLNILVRADGSVGDVRVLDAQPPGAFEAAARDFVRSWSFQPGSYQGAAVDAWVKQRVVFKLQHS